MAMHYRQRHSGLIGASTGEDRLIIEGDAFRYQDLEDKDLREPLKDLGIIVILAEIN